MDSKPAPDSEPREFDDQNDDELEIRWSLTALGEAVVSSARGRRFRGFGPCIASRSSVAS